MSRRRRGWEFTAHSLGSTTDALQSAKAGTAYCASRLATALANQAINSKRCYRFSRELTVAAIRSRSGLELQSGPSAAQYS